MLLTGHDYETAGTQAVQEGAQDYLLKNYLNSRSLSRAVRYAIERQRMREEQQKLIQDLDAFAHRVAHDLKGPLSMIVGYSDLLQNSCDLLLDADGAQFLYKVSKHARKMDNIISELLLLSTVRDLDVQLHPIVDMGEVVAEARRRMAYQISESAARIVQPKVWPAALGYAPWIEGVWVNYISNALKYGRQPPYLELGADDNGQGMVRFWLFNAGSAILPEAQARLFRPFSRLDQVEKIEGHGLGLSILRRIVEKLGGQVGVESYPDKGNRFWFTLYRGA